MNVGHFLLRYLSPLELDIDWWNSSRLYPTVWNSRHRKKKFQQVATAEFSADLRSQLSQDKTRRVVAVVVALQLTSIHRSAAINLVNNRTIFQPLKLWKWFSFNSWLPLFVARGITLIPAWYPSHVSMQRGENARAISNMICIAFLFIVLSTLLSINLRFPSSLLSLFLLCHVFVVLVVHFYLFLDSRGRPRSSPLLFSFGPRCFRRQHSTKRSRVQQTSNLWNKTEWHDLVIDN